MRSRSRPNRTDGRAYLQASVKFSPRIQVSSRGWKKRRLRTARLLQEMENLVSRRLIPSGVEATQIQSPEVRPHDRQTSFSDGIDELANDFTILRTCFPSRLETATPARSIESPLLRSPEQSLTSKSSRQVLEEAIPSIRELREIGSPSATGDRNPESHDSQNINNFLLYSNIYQQSANTPKTFQYKASYDPRRRNADADRMVGVQDEILGASRARRRRSWRIRHRPPMPAPSRRPITKSTD